MLRSLPQLSDLPAQPSSPSSASSPACVAETGVDLAAAYRQHAAQVARWAQRLSGPCAPGDLEDIVHDVFLVAQRRQKEWRGDAKVSTWLYEITIRVVQRRRRTARRWRWLPLPSLPFLGTGDDESTGPQAAMPASPAPTPVEIYEQRAASALLYQLLDGLNEKYRTALILFELEGLPGREIATLTGTSLPNVWMRIMRGRAELARRLAAREKSEGRGPGRGPVP